MITSANRQAWLDTIAWAEGANYNTLFGGGTFSSYAQHPLPQSAIRLPDGRTTSAAGRYQFERGTWDSIVSTVRSITGKSDFSPENQDVGALLLTQRRGALGYVDQGNIAGAVQSTSLGSEWEGLKNKTAAQLQAYFDTALSYRQSGLQPPGRPTSSGQAPVASQASLWTPWTPSDAQKGILTAPLDPQYRNAVVGIVAIVLVIAVLVNAGIL